MEAWIIGLIASRVSLLGVWWQAGGYLSAQRRRLQQELDIMAHLQEGTSVQADISVHTMQSAGFTCAGQRVHTCRASLLNCQPYDQMADGSLVWSYLCPYGPDLLAAGRGLSRTAR